MEKTMDVFKRLGSLARGSQVPNMQDNAVINEGRVVDNTGGPPVVVDIDEVRKVAESVREHVENVQAALMCFCDELRSRAFKHDRSKLSKEELELYTFFCKSIVGVAYNSPEYHQLLKDYPFFEYHARRNDHHPEYFEDVSEMGLMALIEMVCDWHGVYKTKNLPSFQETVDVNVKRFPFTEAQRWVIQQVADTLSKGDDHG